MKLYINSLLLVLAIFGAGSSFSQSGNLLNFDGTDDHVDLDILAPSLTGANNFTVEFWMQASAANQTSSTTTILFAINDSTSAGGNVLLLGISGATTANPGRLTINHTAGIIYTSPVVVADGNCHHIAYVRTQGAGAQIYIDGNLITPVGGIGAPPQLLATHEYGLGAEYDYNGPRTFDQFYNGDMDEVKIWNTARSQAEVQMDMSSTTVAPGMVAYYNCDQGVAFGNNAGQAGPGLIDIASGLNGNLDNFNLSGSFSNFLDYDIDLTITSDNPSPCVGDIVTLTANFTGSNAINFEWSEISNPSVILGTGQTLAVNSPGSYQVTGTASCYNVIGDTIDVVFSPLPDVIPAVSNSCIGDTITLCPQVVSGGPYQYDWGTGLTNSPCTTLVVAGPSGTQLIPVEVFDQNGCSVIIQNEINVLPQPNVPITHFALCPDDAPVPFYTVSDADYFNNFVSSHPAVSEIPNSPPGNTTFVFDPSIAGAGIHTVTVSNDDGCAVVVEFDVVNLTPFVPTNLICSTTPPFAMFPVGLPMGCDYYTYSGDTQGITQATNIFDPAAALPGANIFTICFYSCDNIVCCIEDTIFVGQGPAIQLGPDEILCENETITIGFQNDLGPLVTYSWSGPFTGTPPTSQLIQISTPGTYCLTATGPDGCGSTDCIEVFPSTPINVSPVSVSACINDATALICPQIGTGGAYSLDWGFGSSTLNTCYNAPINGVVGIQDVPVTVTNPDGCEITIINQINVLPVPKLDIQEITPPCEDDQIALIATTDGPYGINWTDQNGNPIGTTGSGQPIYVTPNGTTTYTATVGIAPCDNTQSITVNPIPGPTVTQPTGPFCEGDPVFPFFSETWAELFFTDAYTITPFPSPGITTGFAFTPGVGGPPFTLTYNFNPAIGPGSYTYTVLDNLTGCSTDVTFEVIPEPQLIIPGPLCSNEAVVELFAPPLPPGVIDISFSGPGSNFITSIPGVSYTFDPSQANIGDNNFTACYILNDGTLAPCCVDYNIVVNPVPNVTAVPDITICESASDINIAFKIFGSHIVTPFNYFSPNSFFNGYTSTFTPTQGLSQPTGLFGWVTFSPSAGNLGNNNPITYTVTTPEGCSADATMNITVCPVPQVTINPAIQCQTAQVLSTTVTNTHPDCPVTYQWTLGPNILLGETGPTLDASQYGSGTYCVTASTGVNCSTTDCFTLEVNEPLTINASIPPCDTIGATLTAVSTGNIDPGSIQWTDPNGQPAGNTATINPTMSGDYCVTAQVNGCPPQTVCYTVTIGQGPVITTTAPTQVCEYDAFTASVVVNSDCVAPDVLTIEWYAGNNLIGTGSSVSVAAPSYPAGTVISVVVCCGGCCTTEDVITISPKPIMTAGLPVEIGLCSWDGNPVPTAQTFTTNGNNCTYAMSNGATGVIDPSTGLFDPIAAGGINAYTIIYTCELNGCFESVSNVVIVTEDAEWHKTTSNAALQDVGRDVITDNAGNVYVVGSYRDYTEFDGEVVNSFATTNETRSFIAKYTECGEFLWVANSIISSPNSESSATSVTIDEASGRLFVAGNYNEDLRMLNGHGPLFNNPGVQFAPSVADQQGYVACLDMNNGVILYIDNVTPDVTSETTVNAITINENSGEIYVGGFFQENYVGAYEQAFVEKYTPGATTIGISDWKVLGYGDEDQEVNDMDFDEVNEELWTIGNYEWTIGFDVMGVFPTYLTSSNGTTERTAFVARFSGGNAVVEDFLVGGLAVNGEMTGNGISVDNNAGVAYITGGFEGALLNAFNTASPNLTNPQFAFNAYFAEMNGLGTLNWIHQAEADANLAEGTSASYKNGDVHFTGNYDGDLTISWTAPPSSGLPFNGTVSNVFAISYDAPTGNQNFANGTIGVSAADEQTANSITTDNNNHSFIVGEYQGEMSYLFQGAPVALNLLATPATSTNAYTMRVDLTQNGAFRSPEGTEGDVLFNDAESGIEIVAYPNPTRDLTTILLEGFDENLDYTIQITALDGRTISSENMTNGKVELDLSDYEAGIYIIAVSDGINLYTSRIVKTN